MYVSSMGRNTNAVPKSVADYLIGDLRVLLSATQHPTLTCKAGRTSGVTWVGSLCSFVDHPIQTLCKLNRVVQSI